MSDGQDPRFKGIRESPPSFLVAFMAQAMWVSLCLMPVLAINFLPTSTLAAPGSLVSTTDIIGILLYVGRLSFEVATDRQKDTWVQEKKQKKHEEDFLTRGLWSKSRHSNYFGESTLCWNCDDCGRRAGFELGHCWYGSGWRVRGQGYCSADGWY